MSPLTVHLTKSPACVCACVCVCVCVQLRNRNIVKTIQEEEEAIMQLKVELKVLPLKQQLNTNSS